MLILPTVSSLLGLCKLQITKTDSENLDLFTLGICLPLGEKISASHLVVSNPFPSQKAGRQRVS